MNLDLILSYKDYKGLLFYDELGRVEFSLCDQYLPFRIGIIVLTVFKSKSYLYN